MSIKEIKKDYLKNKLAIAFVSVFMAIGIVACSDSEDFRKSSVVPAAEVDLKVDRDKNDNYKIRMSVENLARPEDLTPARSAYVVWIESKQGSFNIGKLKVNDQLKGSLQGHTPYKPERIKITAEDNPVATEPGKQVVLTSQEIAYK